MSDPEQLPLSIPLLLASLYLGLVCLFPYNSFLSSPTYLEHYYQYAAVKDTDDVATLPQTTNTSFWNNVSNWATVMMLVPMALAQCLMLLSFMLRLNMQIRMFIGAGMMFVAMLLLPVCATGGGLSEGGSIAIVLIACFLTGGFTSVLQSSCYALFGTLPTTYTVAFVLGGGISGSFNSVLRIIIHYSLPSTFSGVKKGAVAFYSVNMAFLVLTCVLVVLLRYNAVVQRCCRAYSLETGVFTDPELVKALEESPADTTTPASEGAVEKQDPESSEPVEDGELQEAAVDAAEPEGDDSSWSVMKRIWLMMFCVFMTMFTTLTYFPGIGLNAMQTSDDANSDSTPENNSEWKAEDVMPMVIILCYNGGDTIGRAMPLIRALWMPRLALVGLVFFRIVACLIPLVLGVVPSKVINSNANPIVVFLFLGITNGYLVGSSFAYGCSDERLKTESEHATAGTCMAFALLIGCSAGSVLALLVVTFAL